MANLGEVHLKKQKRKRMHVYEETHAEWRIEEFSSLGVSRIIVSYDSPTFFVAGAPFYFVFYPVVLNFSDIPQFHLQSNIIRDFSVGYNFGVKKLDGSVEQLQSGILKGKETFSDSIRCVSLSEGERRKSELVPGNVLTLTCTLTPETIHSIETTELEYTKESKLRRLEKLSKNFKDLFGDKDTCDTTLKVKEKEFKAHKFVLIARSSVFAATFKHDTLERQTGVITISDCDTDSFQLFLDYLYSAQLEELSFLSAINLYYTSDKYDVAELKESCLEYLMNCLTVGNVCELAIFADKHDENELFSAVQDFFTQNTFQILLTSDWDDLLTNDPRLANKLLKEMSKAKLKSERVKVKVKKSYKKLLSVK